MYETVPGENDEAIESRHGERSPSSSLSDLLVSVLRVHPEPFEYFPEARVHELLTRDPGSYLSYLTAALQGIAKSQIQLEMPPKQIFSDTDAAGDFRVMPCVVREGSHVRKTVKIVGTNLERVLVPDQITVGKSFVIHPTENFISHVFEACLLSSARTGACAAVASGLLASSTRRLTLMGAGRVNYYTAFYMAAAGRVDRVLIHDLHPTRADRLAQILGKTFPHISCRGVGRSELEETDVLVMATDSTMPLYGPDDFPAELAISLGADTDHQRELNPAWAGLARCYVDTLDTARYGDLRDWIERGLITAGALTDFVAVLRDPKRIQSDRPKLFVSTGTALFDNLTMGYLLSVARSGR